MKVRQASRGRPLVALVVVLACWIGSRGLFWDAAALAPASLPGIAAGPASDPAFVGMVEVEAPADTDWAYPAGAELTASRQAPTPVATPVWPAFLAPRAAQAPARFARRYAPSPRAARLEHSSFPFAPPRFAAGPVPVRLAAAHQMLWMAMLQAPLPVGMALPISGTAAAPFYQHRESTSRNRWSGDGWLLLRGGGGGVVPGAAVASSIYGASQAGAVLRYRLAPESRYRPTAYLRTTAALNGSAEREAALGVSARPFSHIPVSAHAELRASAQAGGTRLRPAVLAVTELPPFELPHKFRGEAYAQAGYVGGRYATAFVDGQLRVDRKVGDLGRAELRAGAGAWGGAQKGAARLDMGPAATMGMGLGDRASARLVIDWRFRIAGDAAPSSGPALTVSAGF